MNFLGCLFQSFDYVSFPPPEGIKSRFDCMFVRPRGKAVGFCRQGRLVQLRILVSIYRSANKLIGYVLSLPKFAQLVPAKS